MPPRSHRGGGQGPNQNQQQQPPPPPPPPQQQQGYGNGAGTAPSHLHAFHHNSAGPGYGDGGRSGMPPRPQHGGNTGPNNMQNTMYGGGGGNHHGQPNMMSPSPLPQMGGGMGTEYSARGPHSPYPQIQPLQQGGGTGTPSSNDRRMRTPGPPNMGSLPPPPPPQQHQYYHGTQGVGGGYSPGMRGSAPPPPPPLQQQPQPQMDASSGYMNSGGGGGGGSGPQQPPQATMRDSNYAPDSDNSPPPQGSSHRGGQAPPPPPPSLPQSMQMPPYPMQQQQQHQYYQSHQNGNGNGGGGRGGGGGGGMPNHNIQHSMPPPPPPPLSQQQQQQMPLPQMMGTGSAPNSANRGMIGPMGSKNLPQGGPQQQQHQQQMMMPPPSISHGQPPMSVMNNGWIPQQMPPNASPPPPPPLQGQPPMGGIAFGGGGGGGGGSMPMTGGRSRMPGSSMEGGGGVGPMANMGGQLPPPPQQRQHHLPPNVMGGGGGGPHMQPGGGGGPMQPSMMVGPSLPGGGPLLMPAPLMGAPSMGGADGGLETYATPGDLRMQGEVPIMDINPTTDLAPQQPLYEFLLERHLLRKTTLDTLFPPDFDATKGQRLTIAIDGNYMVSNLRARLQRTDPLWFLHSCLPDSLLTLVHLHVEEMRAHHLEPLWVLNGISINGDVEAFLPSPDELCSRDIVWEKLTTGDVLPTLQEITEAFETSSAVGEDILRAIQRYLQIEENVVCLTAPFLNWCQMCTLHKEGVAQLLMGPAEMLMVPYGDMKAIAEVNFLTDEVAYYDRDEVLRVLFPHYITETSTAAAGDRFLDFGLLIASHPAITSAHASLQLSTQDIYEELSTAHPHYYELREFIREFEYPPPTNERPNLEQLKHAKGRTYIQYSPVFSNQVPLDSSLVYFKRVLDPSLTNEHMPNNLSGVFGFLVPLSLFYFQLSGLLSVGLMTAVTQLYIRDEFPIADTEEYHSLLHPLMALRGQIISQVVSRVKDLGNSPRLGKLSWVRWFESILMSVMPPERLIVLDEWELSDAPELDSIPEEELGNIDLSLVLSLKSSSMCKEAPVTTPEATGAAMERPILYHGRRQTFLAILLKTFDFIGYFSHLTPPRGSDDAASSTVLVPGINEDQGVSCNSDGAEVAPASEDADEDKPKVFFTAYLSISLSHCPREFQSALLRFTELVRVGTINPVAFKCADSTERSAIPGEDDDTLADPPEVLLATRIACLVSVPYQERLDEDAEFEWAPVYSRQLCAFTVMSRVMNRSLRVLTEAIAAALFLSGFSDCTLTDYNSFIPLLPFGDIPSSIGGLLLHYVLVFPSDYEMNCQTPEERCRLLETKFSAIPNLRLHLRRVMEFTLHALYLLNVYILEGGDVVASKTIEKDVVATALNLLYAKWELHLDGPPPKDVHECFQCE